MKKVFVKQNFPDYNNELDEYSKHSTNKKPRPGGLSRFQLTRNNGHRVGKLYWDKINIVYGFEKRKPFIEIFTLNDLKLTIFQDSFSVRPKEQMNDNCYLRRIIPHFDEIEFYGDFEWKVKLSELRKGN